MRGLESFMYGAKACVNRSASTKSEEQARGCGEIPVEALEKAKQRHCEYHGDRPMDFQRAFKRYRRRKALPQQAVPWCRVTYGGYAHGVEKSSDA